MQQEAEALQRSLDSERQGSGAAAREHSAAMHELRNQLQVCPSTASALYSPGWVISTWVVYA